MHEGHGNDIYKFKGQIIADFSSNIPYQNHANKIIEHLNKGNKLNLLQNYPDPTAKKLTQQIAYKNNVGKNNILVTNGSAEAFYLIAHLFARETTLIATPSFAEYEDACRLHNHKISFCPLIDLPNHHLGNTKTTWFAIPNNPDGHIMPMHEIEKLCQNTSGYIIVDNAYGELSPMAQNIVPLHNKYNNFISVHSLTKTFAVPGVRLGYIIATSDIIRDLKAHQTPWSVNAMALATGEFIMNNYNNLLPDSKKICLESSNFQKILSQNESLDVLPSPCNYFLAKLKHGTAQNLKRLLIENYGLLIRNADNFRSLSPQHFRLSVQKSENNQLLINALNDILVK